jgi:hypothetical protein
VPVHIETIRYVLSSEDAVHLVKPHLGGMRPEIRQFDRRGWSDGPVAAEGAGGSGDNSQNRCCVDSCWRHQRQD